MRFATTPVLAALALGLLTGCGSDVHDGVNMKGKVGFGAVIPCGTDLRFGNDYLRLGAEYHRGMLVAEKTLNASGGVLGRSVKVIVYDSAGEPQKGLDSTRMLTREFDIPFLAVALPRVVDKSAGEYAGHDALTARLEAGPAPATEAPRSIRAFVSVQDEVELMARTARDEGWKRVLLLTVEDRYGDSAAKLLPANLPAGVKLTRLPLRRDALALDAIGRESAGGAYDAVCVFAHGPEIAPALKALRQSGHRGAIVGNHAFAGKSVGMLDRPVLLGLRYTGPAFCAGKDTPMSERFRGEYREYNRDEPDLFAALGYDQVMLVFSAAKAEETLAAKPIRRRIIGDKTFEGAAGTYAFDADGEARMELSLHPVIPAKAPKPVR